MANPRTDKAGTGVYEGLRLSWRLATPGENLRFGPVVYFVDGTRCDCVPPDSPTWAKCVQVFGKTPVELTGGWYPATAPDAA